jgi:hypothetical protein
MLDTPRTPNVDVISVSVRVHGRSLPSVLGAGRRVSRSRGGRWRSTRAPLNCGSGSRPTRASCRHRPAAGLWWPADRAWFVATEIDFEWTFVAGETALVDQLLTDDRLEVARTHFFADGNRAAGTT